MGMVLSLLSTLLHWLQSTVVNLRLVHAHAREIRELAVALSSSLTALAYVLHPPKAKIRGDLGAGALGGRAMRAGAALVES